MAPHKINFEFSEGDGSGKELMYRALFDVPDDYSQPNLFMQIIEECLATNDLKPIEVEDSNGRILALDLPNLLGKDPDDLVVKFIIAYWLTSSTYQNMNSFVVMMNEEYGVSIEKTGQVILEQVMSDDAQKSMRFLTNICLYNRNPSYAIETVRRRAAESTKEN